MTLHSAIRLSACLMLCFGVGFIGGRATYPEIPVWYAGLAKPAGTPPGWVFPVVWNTLYLFMAISLWLLWDRTAKGPARSTAISLFLLQLALNAAWSPVFFAAHQLLLALVIIIAMDMLVAATIVKAWPLNRLAGMLLVPYLAWICYATWLNAGIWLLNR